MGSPLLPYSIFVDPTTGKLSREAYDYLFKLGSGGNGTVISKREPVSVSASSQEFVTVTWDIPFPDDSYTVTVSVTNSSNLQTLIVAHIVTVTAANITVRIENLAGATRTGFVHAIAIHD